jgi:hypothetical protein
VKEFGRKIGEFAGSIRLSTPRSPILEILEIQGPSELTTDFTLLLLNYFGALVGLTAYSYLNNNYFPNNFFDVRGYLRRDPIH